MTRTIITVQEMDSLAKQIGLSHYNDDAMKKCVLINRLGFDIDLETYERENKLSREAEQRKQADEIASIDEWLSEPYAISGGEVLTRGEMLWIEHPTGDDDIPF